MSCSQEDTNSGNSINCVPPTKERTTFIENFSIYSSHFSPFYINEISKLYSFGGQHSYKCWYNMHILSGWGKSWSIGWKMKPGLHRSGWLKVNKGHSAGSQEFRLRFIWGATVSKWLLVSYYPHNLSLWFTVESPCQQVKSLSGFISSDAFFLGSIPCTQTQNTGREVGLGEGWWEMICPSLHHLCLGPHL